MLAVGNIKENYFAGACEEYSKRLGKFCDINIIEVQEKNKLSTPEQCLLAEAKDIEKHLTGFVVVTDKFGKKFDSISFSKKIPYKDMNLRRSMFRRFNFIDNAPQE